jgi:hypothetical protein
LQIQDELRRCRRGPSIFFAFGKRSRHRGRENLYDNARRHPVLTSTLTTHIAMDSLQLILVGFFTTAGILTATFTTVACVRFHIREERDREIFRAYLDCPQEIEGWLVQGAVEQLKQSLPWDMPEQTRYFAPRPARRSVENAVSVLTSHPQAA